MEDHYKSLSHTKWQCNYHVIFIPKYRKRTLFGAVRKEIGPVFKRLAEQKGAEILEGHVMPDHVHMLISIPPKYPVSSVIGYIKGKSAIHVARHLMGRKRNYGGHTLWARGYFVDTVGRNADVIARYIRNQEQEDARQDELNFGPGREEDNGEPKS